MKTLSLKLDDPIFLDTEQVLTMLKKSRNRYINEAINFYNRFQHKKMITRKLEAESKLVSSESMKVLAEFDELNENGN